jgi:hypothetical protein
MFLGWLTFCHRDRLDLSAEHPTVFRHLLASASAWARLMPILLMMYA